VVTGRGSEREREKKLRERVKFQNRGRNEKDDH